MSYVIVGGICFFVGALFGILIMAMMAISADDEGTEQEVR